MLELLFEFLSEFVLQVVIEGLAELGLHSLAAPFQRKSNPYLAAIGSAILGAVAGGVSLLVFRSHFMPAGALRIVNLILTPIAVGFCMSAVGAWRARRGHRVLRIDRFLNGYLFAAMLAVVRFQFAK